MTKNGISGVLVLLLLSACADGPPIVPYPAFVQVDELNDVFMASLPGIRAKQMAGDSQTRRTSNRIDLPPDWKGTSGGSPGRSLEIFVLAGKLQLADIELGIGGYAYLPAGSLGFNMRTTDGARILYFRSDIDPDAVIRSPIIIDAGLLAWEPTASSGLTVKELRKDPGSGAKTWLLKITPGASIPWQTSSANREGYLIAGNYQHSECLAGIAATWQYLPGGYFFRPPGTISGGPEAAASSDAIWLLREVTHGTEQTVAACVSSPTS